jgi:hypothetical protein
MPRLTRQQSATRKMELLKMDMLSILSETTERFPMPYDQHIPIKDAINETINTIIRYMRRSHRIAMLINLYYLGELFSYCVNPRQIWKYHLQHHPLPNAGRYYRAATRVYEVFEDNMHQIYNTRFMSMHYITSMTNREYQYNFLPYVKSLSSEDFAF